MSIDLDLVRAILIHSIPFISMAKILTLLGSPGSGKGSFSKWIIQIRPDWIHLSIGDELRNEVKKDSNLGKEIKDLITKGILVPDTIVNKVAIDRISFINQNSSSKLILLDGYPRSLNQCEFLHKTTMGTSHALRIDLARWVVIKKMLGRRKCINCHQDFNICDIRTDGYDMPAILPDQSTCNFHPCNPQLIARDDDTETIIEARLQSYEDSISDITDFYMKKKLFSKFEIRLGKADTNNLIKQIDSNVFGFHRN